MSNIKRTVERENLSAVFFCEFFHSKIVYMEEKIREGCGSDQGKSQNAVRSRRYQIRQSVSTVQVPDPVWQQFLFVKGRYGQCDCRFD